MEAKEIIYAIAMTTRNNRRVFDLYNQFVAGNIKLINPFTAGFLNPDGFNHLSYSTVCRIINDVPTRQIFFSKYQKRPKFEVGNPQNRLVHHRKIANDNKDKVFIMSERKYVDKHEC